MHEPFEKSLSYHYSLEVAEEHIDILKHVNNVIYLQWVNDISEKHWDILASSEVKAKYFWVVLRHELDYRGEAFLGDELTVKTWIGDSSGAKSIRHVEVLKGDKILLSAASTWCLIDAKTLRPTRIKNDILQILNSPK